MPRTPLICAVAVSLSVGPATAWSQSVMPRSTTPIDLPRRPHTVSRWSVTDGLPGNVVRDMVQSADGQLWLVAGGVLVRFDGERIAAVDFGGPSPGVTRSNEFPLQIERGGGDTIWVGTSAGRILTRTQGTWRAGPSTSSQPATYRIAEMRGRAGVPPVLRAVTPEPTLWQGPTRLLTAWPLRVDMRSNDDQVGIDSSGVIWAVDATGQYARAVGAPLSGQLRPPVPIATGVLVHRGDGRGFLGVRRSRGQLELVDVQGTVVRTMPDAPGRVPRLLARDGRVLASTRTGLEIHYPDGTPPERVPLGALITDREGVTIHVVLEDRDGGLWLGTDILGLVHLRPSFTREFSAPDATANQRQVRRIVPGQRGSVLILADHAIYRLRQDRATELPLLRRPGELGPHAAAEDSRGALWTSLLSGPILGTVLVQEPNRTTRRYERPELPIDFVEDRRRGEMLWLEADHLCRVPLVDQASLHTAPRCTALGGWGARDLLLARDGTVWIAGEAGVRAETATGTRLYTDQTGFPLGLARALHEDADGVLWIGTYRNGLARLERGAGRTDSLVFLNTRTGLAEDVVSTIVEDARGLLWMGGNRGIHAVARVDVDAWRVGRAPRVPALRVDHRDGLTNAEGSGWHATRDDEGYLWFPTFGGAVRIDPFAEYPRTMLVQRAIIDRIGTDSLEFAVRDSVTLPVGVRRLAVDAGAVRLRSPDEVRLEYRLAGHSSGWMSADEPHAIRLAGLRPGAWVLDVRAVAPLHYTATTERPGVDSARGGDADIASIVLVVPPTFRESVWYQLLLLTGVGALFLVGTSVRTRWLSRRAAMLQREVEQQTHLVREERDRAAAALVQATQVGAQLRDLLTAKSRVFASLSHELRTPMSLIVGPLHELEREADTQFPPVARGYIGAIAGAVRRLQRLTSQFLDLADAQSGVLRVRLQRVAVAPFVQQCVEQLAPLAAARDIRLTVSLPSGMPIDAEMDPDQMDKVVTNLVMNAVKHSPDHGEVRVRIDRVSIDDLPHWTLTVSDDGPGVAPALRERIFEPFFQGPGETEGMGLGLALSRDVIVLHKGRVVVLDAGPGASFQVTLPCDMTARAEPALRVAAPVPPPATLDDRGATTPAHPPRDRRRILIVEDDLPLQVFLAEQLGTAHEVRTVSRGDEALTVLREWPADAVVSDVVMPGLDGVALCRILKADPLTRNIPVVLLTARGAREDQVEGLAAGADDYIVKPFDPEQLRLKVDNLMQLRRNLEDRFRRALPAWSSILLRAGSEPLDRPSEQFLERLYGILVEHIPDQGFDVEQLARSLAMSRASLYRRVKELLDTTPVDLLQTVRLEHAALLLRTEEDTIASIAHRTGFKWAPTFTVRFTSHFGMTPSAYRALHQQGKTEGGARSG